MYGPPSVRQSANRTPIDVSRNRQSSIFTLQALVHYGRVSKYQQPLISHFPFVSVSAKMMSRSLRLAAATAVATCLAASSAGAFQPVSSSARPITALSAAQRNSNANDEEDVSSLLGGVRGIAAAFALFAMTTLSGPAGAVSGGGLDYANLDITGQDFSNEAKTYKGKDFSVSLDDFVHTNTY